MVNREIFLELTILGIIGYFLFFVSTNVDPILGTVYTLPLLLGITLAIVDKLFGSRTIKFMQRNVSWGKVILYGIAGYILVILSSQLSSSIANAIPLKELLESFAATAPVFSESPAMNYIIFGFVIAIVETYTFFVIALDIFCSLFKVPIDRYNLFNPKMILIVTAISFTFLLYHITAKGIGNESTLILTFFMAIISLITIIITRDMRAALIIHILANSIAATSLFTAFNILNLNLPMLIHLI